MSKATDLQDWYDYAVVFSMEELLVMEYAMRHYIEDVNEGSFGTDSVSVQLKARIGLMLDNAAYPKPKKERVINV